MSWLYIRKQVRLGALHLNLSRKGLGFSLGVRGARIARTATGRLYFQGSRHGVYVRKYIKKGR